MRAFSLVELLVTVSVLGVLASMSIAMFEEYREKARQSQAQVELKNIYFAINTLEIDTRRLPGNISANGPCVVQANNNEFGVNDCRAGLSCTNGSFPNWKGPYLRGDQLVDPWGTPYQYDQDYECKTSVNGCNRATWARVVATAGPDKIVNNYDSLESALVMCYQ